MLGHDRGTGFEEALDDPATDSTGSPGDQHGPVGQVEDDHRHSTSEGPAVGSSGAQSAWVNWSKLAPSSSQASRSDRS